MGTLILTPSETKLCRKVAHGDRVVLRPDEEISAEVIRHIVLGLPIFPERPVRAANGSQLGRQSGGRACGRTAVGVRICGGIVRGRLKLDSAVGTEGSPMCPLEFQDTWFDGGFSGANSRFGHLGFRKCHFNDRPVRKAATSPPESSADIHEADCDPEDRELVPTVELSGATIEGGLDMQGIAPLGDGDGRTAEEGQLPNLWIRAIGTRIGGNLNLSCAHLKAPPDDLGQRDLFALAIQPLDLSLARIEGDFAFLGDAISEGPIGARSAKIAGDVWMSGATIVCRPGDRRALFFQLATIGGGLMLDGRREKADGKSGDFRTFWANGLVNLFAISVEGSIVLNNAELSSEPDSEGEDLCLCLTGARIGDRVEIERYDKSQPARLKGRIRLDRMEVGTVVTIDGVELGGSRALKSDEHCIDARVLSARHVTLQGVRSSPLEPPSGQSPAPALSINLANARLERLTIKDTHLTGPLDAAPLHCNGDVVLDGIVVDRVNLEGSTIGGSLDISALRIKGSDALLSLKGATIARALRLTPDPPKAEARFELSGTADLTALTCDTLEDDIGRRWGGDAVIKMNHFSYQRTGWLVGKPPDERGQPARKSIYRAIGDWNRRRHDGRVWPWHRFPRATPRRWDPADPKRPQPSYRIVSDWLQSRKADGRFPWRLLPSWLLSDDEDYCKPWQHRRNWIYQQYKRKGDRNPYVSLIRRRIREDDYHPQPFEQAIKVARAEGREEFATQFEMHKQYLEWKFFNQHVRWGLGLAGIALAALWLVIGGTIEVPRLLWTGLACFVTILLMIFGSALRDMLRRHLFLPALLKPRRALNGLVALTMGLLLGMAVASGTSYRILLGIAAVSATVVLIAILCLLVARWAAQPKPRARADWAAWWSSKFLTWLIYWVPAAVLFVAHWQDRPFRFLIAMLIFVVIRWLAAIAHQLMRFGFGYLRQPIRAVVTLILAFLVGWWGVYVANSRGMFVVAAEPVAGLVGVSTPTAEAEGKAKSPGRDAHDEAEREPHLLMGSEAIESMNFAGGGESPPSAPQTDAGAGDDRKRGIRDISCAHEISEPLYALDVLVPIVDLGEERRCEVRRFSKPGREVVPTETLSFRQLYLKRGDWPLNDHRFWWWMKAVYAIAGWVLVSLALLTFAQVNRTHGEPAE